MLYEKENTVQYSGTNPSDYFESEKYYTMRPGIDFPIIMSYKNTDNPNFASYYYFLNGHNDVEVASPAFLQTRNDILRLTLATAFDTGLQFNRMRYYNPNLGRFCQKDLFSLVSNGFSYELNNPVIYYDPFGLYGRWVQLKLPAPSGWAWEVISCDNPVSNSDCQELCLTGSLCEGCCRKLYEDRWNDPGFDECLKGCGSQVIIYQ